MDSKIIQNPIERAVARIGKSALNRGDWDAPILRT